MKSREQARRRENTSTPSQLVIAVAVFLVCGVVNLQIPVLETYAVDAGAGNGAAATVLAAYPAVLVAVLSSLGGASDRLGRKPVLLGGLAAAALATACTIAWPSLLGLGLARGVQGIGVGLTLGAATAWLASLGGIEGPRRAAATTALTSAAGFGLGALVTQASLELGADGHRPASYPIMIGLLAVTAGLVLALPAPAEERTGTPPRLARPPAYPPGSGLAALSILVGWSLAGTVVAVVPRALAAIGAPSLAGPAVFVLLAAGIVAQPFARRLTPRRAVLVGAAILPVGGAVIAAGVALGEPALVLLGVAIGGVSTHGYGYLGGLALVTREAETRARAVSGYFLVAYVGFSVPAMAVGVAADQLGMSWSFVGLAVALAIGAAAVAGLTRRSAR